MLYDLDVDNLIPFMPQSVKEEYLQHGDAGIFGFSPGVKRWLETCTHPRVEKWRYDLKTYTAYQIKEALEVQQLMIDQANQLPKSNGLIRPMTVPLHPTLKGWMETHDRHAWKDPASLKDTKRRHPKLFR